MTSPWKKPYVARSGSSEWPECPRCKAPRIRSRYDVQPGKPGFDHKPDCRFMARHRAQRRPRRLR